MFKKRVFSIIAFVVIIALGFTACGGGRKVITSAIELKDYLDKQPANSPDDPIKVRMNATNMMIKDIGDAIRDAGKYIDLDLSRSTALTIIGEGTFLECIGLTNILLPDSVTEIGDNAFAYTSITSFIFPNSINELGSYVFAGCENLIIFNGININDVSVNGGGIENSFLNGTWKTEFRNRNRGYNNWIEWQYTFNNGLYEHVSRASGTSSWNDPHRWEGNYLLLDNDILILLLESIWEEKPYILGIYKYSINDDTLRLTREDYYTKQ